ncbi:hypothetical protein ACHAW5_004441 [Stephanodiscus triporus]|uniref:Uncharacterized protein n=1 Tax=Stephanodiscus triporus TaxID=2934178 RepID=A0ABD3Q7P6_9STRA
MIQLLLYVCLSAFTLVPSRSFLPLVVTPLFGGTIRSKSVVAPHATSTARSASGDDEDGGTAWPPPTDFTRGEIDDMEKLIVSLSMEPDDDKRRGKLAEILDKELVCALNAESDSQGGIFNSDIPRFAKLFQISLDTIGERVQSAAREVALEKQQQQEQKLADSDCDADDAWNSTETNGLGRREKSKEELQLWALIDMMVQSKTRVKLHMGSLGSKGNFR